MTVPGTGRGHVVVIGGPIVSGRSTLARAVADAVVAGGRGAVALDLDLVYELFDRGVEDDARIVEGDVDEDLVARLGPPVVEVVLDGSLALARDRVGADPSRRLSRDHAFLARHDAEPRRHPHDAIGAGAVNVRPVRSLTSDSLWRRAR